MQKLSSKAQQTLNNWIMVASLAIIVVLSLEVFVPSKPMILLSQSVQLAVCILFLIDFFVRLDFAEDKSKYLRGNWLFFLVSIPYLFIFSFTPICLHRGLYYFLHIIPLVRGCYALGLLMAWLGRNRYTTLFATYLGALVLLVYFASLIFYEYELGVNSYVTNYGRALWWAWMDVTTVGSNIIAETTIGRILSVMLAAMGMMVFPIFTTFILGLYQKKE